MNGTIERRMAASGWILLVVLSVLWGGSFFFTEVALREFGPLTVVFGRVAIGAGGLWLLVLATGQQMPREPRILVAFVVMGGLNNLIPFALIAWGQTGIGSGMASILNATTPVFTVVLAHFLTRDERMTAGGLAGVLAGLAGVAVMIGPAALADADAGLAARIAVLGGALSYGLAGIWGRRFAKLGVPPLVTATGQVTASAAMMAPLALIAERPWELPVPGVGVLAALAGIGLLSTALAYVIYFHILARAGATNLLLVTLLIPVSAVLLGVLVLGEALEAGQVAGMALIASGLAAIDGRPLTWLRGRR